MTDQDLLRQYARDRSEPAFAELVRRHVEWVRASAARQLGGDDLADDAAQAVFIVLAKKAAGLGERTPLAPWLFGVLRRVAGAARRDERRRRRHERLAAAERAEHAIAHAARSGTADDRMTAEEWSRVARVLDDSVARLRPADRDAVLLRFYQRKSFAEVGAALGGVSEDAARKRIDRAIEHLRIRLAGRGLETSLGAVAPALWANATPAGTASATTALPLMTGMAAAGRPLQLAKGAMKMAAYSALGIPAAYAAAAVVVVVTGIALLNGAAPPDSTTVMTTTAPATAPATLPRAATVPDAPPGADPTIAAAPDEPAPPPKTVLDKQTPSIRADKPLAVDTIIELVQDMTRLTITVEWEKLGIRGDKGVTLDLPPMPLRDTLNAILKTAGAKKQAKMTVEGAKVLVTAAPDDAKNAEKK